MSKNATPQPIRGMQSMLGEEADRFAHVVATFDRVRRLYGFKRVEVPVLEPTAVFARTMGETTDVVSKEMYSFEDRSGDQVTLRPEFTAGICRAFLSEGWQQYAPLKVATHGPAFRYERPQKGRFRQFHQLDAEIIGAAEPQADVELLAFGAHLLAELGIKGVTLKLNTLGDVASRDAWRAQLVEHFASHRGDLSEDSKARLDKNPLRILDSKDPRDRPFADSAPPMTLTAEASDFFAQVRAGLDAAGVAYELAPHLVRGLDYYRHTAFEFVTDQLGAQGTVLAGGRYDGLDRTTRRPAHAGGGLGSGNRAARHDDRRAGRRDDRCRDRRRGRPCGLRGLGRGIALARQGPVGRNDRQRIAAQAVRPRRQKGRDGDPRAGCGRRPRVDSREERR